MNRAPMHRRTGMAKRIQERIAEARGQQDNEQWHLLIVQEQILKAGIPESRLKFFWLPQAIAFFYYQLSWLMFVLKPALSYHLNADFEDHAEHEYMEWVAEHPEWETEPFESELREEYGAFESLADLFRQIGHDERVHKQESIKAIERHASSSSLVRGRAASSTSPKLTAATRPSPGGSAGRPRWRSAPPAPR